MNRFALALAAGLLAAAAPAAPPDAPAGTLVAHEWGTFTSFAGSDGVPVGFTPDNSALPEFVHRTHGPYSKSGRLMRDGTVSLETPVIYFYADRETKLTATVDFAKGWVTEWFPTGRLTPSDNPRVAGERMKWNVTLVPGGTPAFPDGPANVYDRARETDAVPLRYDVPPVSGRGPITQWEKFLFYRGVGTFAPTVAVKALGNGTVRVTNPTRGPVGGLVLVTVRGGKVGFRPLAELAAGASTEATIPGAAGGPGELAALLEKQLTAAGLYPKEAKAMVRTWEAAWFGEAGTRLMYLVPRATADAILPLTIDPKPTEVARVLVGRHEFLTPEQEADAEKQVAEARAAGADLGQDGREVTGFGRFAPQARAIGERRLAGRRQ